MSSHTGSDSEEDDGRLWRLPFDSSSDQFEEESVQEWPSDIDDYDSDDGRLHLGELDEEGVRAVGEVIRDTALEMRRNPIYVRVELPPLAPNPVAEESWRDVNRWYMALGSAVREAEGQEESG